MDFYAVFRTDIIINQGKTFLGGSKSPNGFLTFFEFLLRSMDFQLSIAPFLMRQQTVKTAIFKKRVETLHGVHIIFKLTSL